jgi:hypothetical protein
MQTVIHASYPSIQSADKENCRVCADRTPRLRFGCKPEDCLLCRSGSSLASAVSRLSEIQGCSRAAHFSSRAVDRRSHLKCGSGRGGAGRPRRRRRPTSTRRMSQRAPSSDCARSQVSMAKRCWCKDDSCRAVAAMVIESNSRQTPARNRRQLYSSAIGFNVRQLTFVVRFLSGPGRSTRNRRQNWSPLAERRFSDN